MLVIIYIPLLCPEMIPLSGGLPNPKLFPFKNLNVEVMDGNPIRYGAK